MERAIRHAIDSAWKKNGPQVYFEIAGYLPSEKPTNGQFIAALSEYFRLQKEERPKKISWEKVRKHLFSLGKYCNSLMNSIK